MYMYVSGCTRMCRCARVGIKCAFIFTCVFGCVLQHLRLVCTIRTVAGDSYPIRIRARCGPNTKAIRRPIHEMIRRLAPVHAVKTKR